MNISSSLTIGTRIRQNHIGTHALRNAHVLSGRAHACVAVRPASTGATQKVMLAMRLPASDDNQEDPQQSVFANDNFTPGPE